MATREKTALWGVFLAVLATTMCSQAHAQATCEDESDCSFKKPNVLLVLDYSSSMTGPENAPAFFPVGQTVTTRWTAALEAASWIVRYDQGFFANNTRIGLSRFAHDPDVNNSGTHISSDRSFPPITDGYAIDVPFDGSDGNYFQCKASGVEAAIELLRTKPPPAVGGNMGRDPVMLTWTRGALRSARELIEETRERHKDEPNEGSRTYQVVLMTDGDWTCPDMFGQACDEDPAPESALLRAAGVPVYVIAFGDATMQPSLNEVALQGGTGKAIDAASPQGIIDALRHVLDNIRNSVIVPTCTQKLPRLMITMDASSSMLQGEGETKWDKARYALSGNPRAPNPGDPGYVEPVLTRKLQVNGRDIAVEDIVHLGMIAFAGPAEQQELFGFGPCMRDNIAWAMDPQTSCVAPECSYPNVRAPHKWTFKDSDKDRDPRFVRQTHSYMPPCDRVASDGSCEGSTASTFTGQGLEFTRQRIRAYRGASAPFPQNDQTHYVNILITDGQTSEGSSDVQSALRGLLVDGIKTYVVGFGTDAELDRAQLDQYAAWGDTEQAIVVDPTRAESAGLLADALAGIVSSLSLDACCVLNQCASEPEPADPQSVCGDGKVEGNEVCDDGARNASYGHCNASCNAEHLFCGDGRIDGPEECDDGNRKRRDGCSRDCRVEDDFDAGVDDPAVTSRVGSVPPGVGRRTTAAAGATGGSAAVGPTATVTSPAQAAGASAAPALATASEGGCGCHVLGAPSPGPARGMWLLGLCMAALLRPWSRMRARRRDH